MTTHQAKKIVANILTERNAAFTKLTAKTIDFTDLARAKCIFVRVHGFVFDENTTPLWRELRTIAGSNGFRVEV
jgi:hypothetical protein